MEGRRDIVLGRGWPAGVEPRRRARTRCIMRRARGIRRDEAGAANKPREASAKGILFHYPDPGVGSVHATSNSPHVEAGVDWDLRLVPRIPSYLAEALEQAWRRVQQVVGQDSGAVHLEAVFLHGPTRSRKGGIRGDGGSGRRRVVNSLSDRHREPRGDGRSHVL